jgi:hypothetical protein
VTGQPEPRRAEVYAARRVTTTPGRPPWLGYARCAGCGWWCVSTSVDDAEEQAAAHRCPREPR